MGSEKGRRRYRRSAVRRAWLYSLLLSLPGLIFAGVLLFQHRMGVAPGLLVASCLLIYLSLIAAALIESVIRPLQTLSNVVSSLREGDYSFRARGAGPQDPLAELAAEINALADLLQRSEEHTSEL